MIERRIIRDIGTALVNQLAEGAKTSLTEQEAGLSGDDSGLANVWEELCVQVQGEESIFWDSYVAFADNAIREALADLPLPLRQAMSLKTDLGDEWLDEPDESGVVPVFEDEIVALVRSVLLFFAGDYESETIERFKYGTDYDEDEDEDDALSEADNEQGDEEMV